MVMPVPVRERRAHPVDTEVEAAQRRDDEPGRLVHHAGDRHRPDVTWNIM